MPYQGNRRCFGEFRCAQCNRTWMSAYSWAKTEQKCRHCNIFTLPFRQSPLEKRKTEIIDPNIAHPQELCAKCKKLGRFCGRYNS